MFKFVTLDDVHYQSGIEIFASYRFPVEGAVVNLVSMQIIVGIVDRSTVFVTQVVERIRENGTCGDTHVFGG